MQIKREIALFSGEIYTAGTNFTRPLVMTVATNLNSGVGKTISHFRTHSSNLNNRGKKGLVMGVVVAKAKRTVFGGQEGK